MKQTAAVMVIDHYPTDDEVEELTYSHLDDFPADYATATTQIVRKAPDFLAPYEQDQMNAFIRDSRTTYLLVVYMQEAAPFEDDEDEDDDF